MLAMSKRLLTCPVLSLRIKGMTQIKDLIKLVCRRDRRHGTRSSGASTAHAADRDRTYAGLAQSAALGLDDQTSNEELQWLTEPKLAQWLASERVIEIVLGDPDVLSEYDVDETHPEILRRSDDMLVHCAEHGQLSAAHLDLLWAASAAGQPEAQLRTVYRIVVRIAGKLDAPLVDHIYASIRKLPCEQHEVLQIELFRGFAEHAVLQTPVGGGDTDRLQTGGDIDSGLGPGIELLWRDVQDDAPVSGEVADLAADALCVLLLQENAFVQRARVLELCVDILRSESFASQPLKVIYRLFNPTVHSIDARTHAQFLQGFQAQHGLLNLIVDETIRYHDRAASSELAQRLCPTSSSSQEVAKPSSNADADASSAPQLVRERSGLASVALVGRVPYREALVMRLDILCLIAENCSVSLTHQHVTLLWGRLVRHSLLADEPNLLLAWLGRVVPDDDLRHAPRRARLTSAPMTDEAARECFQSLLCSADAAALLHVSLRHEGYKCIEKLFRFVNHRDAKLRPATNRACFLVEDTELHGLDILWALFLSAQDMVVARASSDFLVSLHIHLASSVDRRTAWQRCLRRCIDHVSCVANTERAARDTTLVTTDASVAAETASRAMGFLVRFLQKIEATMSHAPDLCAYPRRVLSDEPGYFSALFGLLLLRTDARALENAFYLLQLLPKNGDMVTQLRSFDDNAASTGVQWPVLLGSKSILQLYYKLQIVDALVAESSAKDGVAWSDRFVRDGGLGYLVSTPLMEYASEELSSTALNRACFALLLKLILSLVSPSAIVDDRVNGKPAPSVWVDAAGVEHLESVVGRLIEILHVVSGVEKAAPASSNSRSMSDADEANDDLLDLSHSGGAQNDSAVAEIVQHTLALLVILAHNRPSVFDAMLRHPDLPPSLVRCLLHADQLVRARTVKQMLQMCGEAGEARLTQHFADVLLRSRSAAKPYADRCHQFFSLTSQVVACTAALEHIADAALVSEAAAISGEISSRPIVEEAETDTDLELQGLLSLLKSLLASSPTPVAAIAKAKIGHGLIHNLVESLFSVPLKGVPQHGPPAPRCKHPESRARAYALLAELSKGCAANYIELLRTITPHHQLVLSPSERAHREEELRREFAQRRANGILKRRNSASAAGSSSAGSSVSKRASQTTATSNSQTKSQTGLTGLKNLGCICYMNATLQQLFMIREFRRGILTLGAPAAVGHEEGEAIDLQSGARDAPSDGGVANEESAGSLMYELQHMFAYLQETDRAYYDPRGFCNAFKTWDGDPINVYVQQDASEFLTMFSQQLESIIMGTNHQNLLKDTVGGAFSNELIVTSDVNRYSERPEPFHYISVDIKDRKNLPEALERFISGETVDFTWESKDEAGNTTKVSCPTTKRISIKTLPRHLLIHLKRFEFDFETLQQVKINARFEFPSELDMFPYTKAGRRSREGGTSATTTDKDAKAEAEAAAEAEAEDQRPSAYYMYRLSGIVVHAGTANSGHYYSFVRERGSDAWYEFNDTLVTSFDANDLETECFGGDDLSEAATGRSQSQSGGKARNAFMLVYDQHEYQPEIGDDGHNGSGAAKQPLAPIVPPAKILQEIRTDNQEYWRRRHVVDPAYFDFMEAFFAAGVDITAAQAEADDRPTSLEVLQLGAHFSLGTLVRASPCEKVAVARWTESLLKLCVDARFGAAASSWLEWLLVSLAVDQATCLDLLVQHDETAEIAALFLSKAVQHAADAVSFRFLDTLVTLVQRTRTRSATVALPSRTPRPAHTSCQALELVCFCAQESSEIRSHLVRSGRLSALLALFADIGHGLRVGEAEQAGAAVGKPWIPWNDADVDVLLKVLSLLLRSCVVVPQLGRGQTKAPSPHALEPAAQLPARERESVLSAEFAARLLREVRTPARKSLALSLLAHLLWENQVVSELFVNAACAGIERDDHDDLKPYFRGMMVMFQLEDTQQSWRTSVGMTALINAMEAAQRYIKATEVGIMLLIRIAKGSEHARSWLSSNAASCGWIEAWLTAKRTNQVGTAGRSLLKPPQTHQPEAWRQQTHPRSSQPPSPPPQPLSADHLGVMLANMRALLEGSVMPHTTYDSDDDQTALIGKRIKVRWAGDRYYRGTVIGYCEATSQHHVVYEDGDERHYELSQKTWRIDS